MKKNFLSLIISIFVLLSLCCIPVAAATDGMGEESNCVSNGNLCDCYQAYVNYSAVCHPDIELMTYDQFQELYKAQDSESVDDYLAYLKATIDGYSTVTPYSSSSSSSSGSGNNWYNIGTKLPEEPSYGKYDFSGVKAGDILYEGTGFGGLTGHIAIVEGWFHDDKRAHFRCCHCPLDRKMGSFVKSEIKKLQKMEELDKEIEDIIKEGYWKEWDGTWSQVTDKSYCSYQRAVRYLAKSENLMPIEYDYVHFNEASVV